MGFKFGKTMGMNESTFIHINSIIPYPAKHGEYGELLMPANGR
jgi:hypothetical protein